MINQDFYPTPEGVIEKMLEPYLEDIKGYYGEGKIFKSDKRNIQILEPSAGKGDILDYICNKLRFKKENIYAIESEPDLVSVLQNKGYKVIENDFLNYNGDYYFDFIFANPPFSKDVEHILKMWEVIKNGDIVTLVNSETINNPYTKKRKLLNDIIEKNGSVEHLGNVFKDSERNTNVDVSLMRLYKREENSDFDFEFENVTNETKYEFSDEVAGNDIAISNLTDAMLRQYEKTKEAYVDYLKVKEKLDFYSKGLLEKSYSDIDKIIDGSESETKEKSYNNFLDSFKLEAWRNILSKLNIEKYLTRNVLDNFEQFAKSQGCLDLTKENIRNLILMIADNKDNILDQAVVEVFDMFTKYHKENRYHIEGWKTNDFWKVNKKVILPNAVEVLFYHYYPNFHNFDDYGDIDKVMCYLTGKNFDNIKGIKDIISQIEVGDRDKYESEFFYIRCFKKGTMHLEFKDEDLWARFNQKAVDGKNWLGGQ